MKKIIAKHFGWIWTEEEDGVTVSHEKESSIVFSVPGKRSKEDREILSKVFRDLHNDGFKRGVGVGETQTLDMVRYVNGGDMSAEGRGLQQATQSGSGIVHPGMTR